MPINVVEFTKIARDIADQLHGRDSALQRELADVESIKAEIEAELNLVRGVAERLNTYQAKVGIDYLCPRCWIEDADHSRLRPILSMGREDSFRCESCDLDVTLQGATASQIEILAGDAARDASLTSSR
jgi:hypothetical protein